MTYEEKYREQTTVESLIEEVKSDIMIAKLLGSADRIRVIKETAERVLNDKFADVSDDVLKAINDNKQKEVLI